MMSVEQVMDAIRRNDTVAAKQHVVVEAYDRLWREAQAQADYFRGCCETTYKALHKALGEG